MLCSSSVCNKMIATATVVHYEMVLETICPVEPAHTVHSISMSCVADDRTTLCLKTFPIWLVPRYVRA